MHMLQLHFAHGLTQIREKGNGSWFMAHHNRNFEAVDTISHFSTMISLIKTRFSPSFLVRGIVSQIFKDKFEGSWIYWGDVPKDVKDEWFDEFNVLFKWLPKDEDNIIKSFNSKGSTSLKNALHKVRTGEGEHG
ncbi:hypothetical protein RIF29_10251 [Crotalaria pallida]|uniref:Uncharacterized protein n=1 Tax=Crotalaria pallida TaxID=3830 RepID=A0AAN9FSK9_CROPI